MAYDLSKHSKARLGMVMHIGVCPFMPTAAQASGRMIHLKMGDGGYLNLPPIGLVPPDQISELAKAFKGAPIEPSYSNSGANYRTLEVKPADDGKSCDLYLGTVKLTRLLIDPSAPIVSLDEPFHEQVSASDSGDDSDPDPTDDPDE